LPGFVVKNNAARYSSLRREKSHEIVIKMLRVGKSWRAHAAFWKNLWAKAQKLVQIEARSTRQKRGLCWITNWQFYWSRSYVRPSLKIPSQY